MPVNADKKRIEFLESVLLRIGSGEALGGIYDPCFWATAALWDDYCECLVRRKRHLRSCPHSKEFHTAAFGWPHAKEMLERAEGRPRKKR